MMIRGIAITVAAIVGSFIALVVPPAHADNVVVNGSFELGSTVATNPPWTVSDFLDAAGEGIDYGIDTSPVDAESGNNSFYGMGFNDGFNPVVPTVLSQVLSTTPGRTYNIMLGFANFGGGLGEIEVLWGGTPIYDNPNVGPQDYTNIVLTALATGASTTLSIELTDLGGFPLNVDSVSASVPEPGTIALLLAGLAGVGFARRKAR